MRLMRINMMVAVVVLVMSAPAHAAMDYYTWGGFTVVVPALTNISNVFGNSDYHAMFTAFAIFGVFFGLLSAYFGSITGKGNPHIWAIQLIIGSLIYFGLFVPKDTLFVYDPVLNRNQEINGLPEGFVFAAGCINLVERFVVQTFDTSANLPPSTGCGPMAQLNYADQGGAIGLSTLQSSLSQLITDSSATQTVVKYVDDCVIFEMTRPGTNLTINGLLDPGCGGATAFLDTIALAANPANYTTSYLEGATNGTVTSCAQAFSDIQAYYTNAANSNQAVQSACGSNSITDAGQCQNILSTMISGSLGISMDPGTFIAMNSLTAYTNTTLLTAGSNYAAASGIGTSQAQAGNAGGFTSGILNPMMIDAYVAYSFMVFPIIALFIVTPLWRQAITLVLGMILWNTLVRAVDVVAFHMWVTQYQNALANALNNSGMGITAGLNLPIGANKYLGQLAQMRSNAFMLATVISGALFKFSDSSLSRIASDAKIQNSRTEKALEDPNERGKQVIENSAGSARTIAMTQALKDGVYGATNTIGQGMVANEFANSAGGMGKMDNAGGSMGGMMEQQRQISSVTTANQSGYAVSVTPGQSTQMGQVQASKAQAELEALGMYGNSPQAQARQNSMAEVMQKGAQGMSIQAQAEQFSKDTGMSVPDSFKAIAASNIAQGGATAEYWAQHGGVEGQSQFYKENAALSHGQTEGMVKAAAAHGLDLREAGQKQAAFEMSEKQAKIGKVQAAHPGLSERQRAIERAAATVAQPQPVNPQQTTGGLQRHLAAGNMGAILASKPEAAMIESLTGKSAGELAAMPPDQQRQAMRQAEQTLQPSRTPEQLQAVERAQQAATAAQVQPVDPQQTTLDMRQHLDAGNMVAILASEPEAAAFKEMTGMGADHIAAMPPEQQQSAIKWAQNKAVETYGADPAQAGAIVGEAEGTNVNKMTAETDAFRSAAEAVAQKSPELRNNDLYFHDGKITEAGLLKAALDSGLARPQSFGDLSKEEKAMGGLRKAITLDGNKAATGTALEGKTADPQQMEQLAKYLDANKLHKSAAGVRNLEKHGNGFDYTLAKDGAGHVTGFQATSGGHTLFQDRSDVNTLDTRESGHDFENKNRDVSTTDKGSSVKNNDFSGSFGGFTFSHAQFTGQGDNATVVGRPVGSETMMTVKGVADRGPDGKPTGGYSLAATGQEGGVKFSGDGLVQDLDAGKLGVLNHVMRGSEQEKREYASKITEESAKLADVQFAEGKDYHATAKAGIDVLGTGIGASAGYSKKQQLAVKQMTAQVENILGSSGSAHVAAQRIQALRNEMTKAAKTDYKIMNFGDTSSKPRS